MKMFSIRDDQLGTYLRPFNQKNAILAQRSIASAIPESQLEENPEVYTLYELAEFDEEAGTFKNLKKPTIICSIVSLVKKPTTVSDLRDAIQKK